MAKLIVNNKFELNGKITVRRTLENESLIIVGSLATHYYLEEITSLETDRFIIDKIEVFEEVFGSDDFDSYENTGYNELMKEDFDATVGVSV